MNSSEIAPWRSPAEACSRTAAARSRIQPGLAQLPNRAYAHHVSHLMVHLPRVPCGPRMAFAAPPVRAHCPSCSQGFAKAETWELTRLHRRTLRQAWHFAHACIQARRQKSQICESACTWRSIAMHNASRLPCTFYLKHATAQATNLPT